MPPERTWLAYLAGALIAELLLPVAPLGTALIDAAVVVLALSQFGWAQRSPLAIGDPGSRVLPAVALMPLLRLLSLTMPVPDLPRVAWVVLAGAPLLFAVPATARLAFMTLDEMALVRISRDRISVAIALASGVVGFSLGRVVPSGMDLPLDTPVGIAISAAAVVACAAIPEELVFRGLLQPLMVDAIGPTAVVIAAVASGITYVGTGSLFAIAIMTATGLVYGWEVSRSRSLWAPIVGHSLLVVGALVIAPLLTI
jgi:uncharacterized protein